MKTTQDVIETAIRGGWKPYSIGAFGYLDFQFPDIHNMIDDIDEASINDVIVDPLFWQALGKELGWCGVGYVNIGESKRIQWKQKMYRMIDHLINGGTVEEYLISLLDKE